MAVYQELTVFEVNKIITTCISPFISNQKDIRACSLQLKYKWVTLENSLMHYDSCLSSNKQKGGSVIPKQN